MYLVFKQKFNIIKKIDKEYINFLLQETEQNLNILDALYHRKQYDLYVELINKIME